MNDTTLLVCHAGLGVLCDHVHTLNQNGILLRIYGNYLALFVFIFAGDHLNGITFFNL